MPAPPLESVAPVAPVASAAPGTAMPVASGPLPADEVDAVVIGGGANGTGVARDLALRGLRVVLFERNDLAFGASGNSSGMIHGGARYMLQSPNVTETSCRDSGYIQRIAPHLLFRIPFLLPLRTWLCALIGGAEAGLAAARSPGEASPA